MFFYSILAVLAYGVIGFYFIDKRHFAIVLEDPVAANEMTKKELAFTQSIFDSSILKEQTIITIEDPEEKVYAFMNLIPDYAPGEATYDLIRKVSGGPNGVLDMLLAKTLLYLKEQGYSSVNMGLAPLSGIEGINMAQKTIKYISDFRFRN